MLSHRVYILAVERSYVHMVSLSTTVVYIKAIRLVQCYFLSFWPILDSKRPLSCRARERGLLSSKTRPTPGVGQIVENTQMKKVMEQKSTYGDTLVALELTGGVNHDPGVRTLCASPLPHPFTVTCNSTIECRWRPNQCGKLLSLVMPCLVMYRPPLPSTRLLLIPCWGCPRFTSVKGTPPTSISSDLHLLHYIPPGPNPALCVCVAFHGSYGRSKKVPRVEVEECTESILCYALSGPT